MEYKLRWEIDLDADSPEEAAKLAHLWMRDYGHKPIFEVRKSDEGEDAVPDLIDCAHLDNEESTSCMVATGNIADGMMFYGPFINGEEANEWADRSLKNEEWICVFLSEPK